MRRSTSAFFFPSLFRDLGAVYMAIIEIFGGEMGESCPILKMSPCTPMAMGKCIGNPWKRARTVPVERTSDFERPASEIAV